MTSEIDPQQAQNLLEKFDVEIEYSNEQWTVFSLGNGQLLAIGGRPINSRKAELRYLLKTPEGSFDAFLEGITAGVGA